MIAGTLLGAGAALFLKVSLPGTLEFMGRAMDDRINRRLRERSPADYATEAAMLLFFGGATLGALADMQRPD